MSSYAVEREFDPCACAIGCGGSGSKPAQDVLNCGESIDQLRAAGPPPAPYDPDYTTDFTTEVDARPSPPP
jgi:hypothetical protein